MPISSKTGKPTMRCSCSPPSRARIRGLERKTVPEVDPVLDERLEPAQAVTAFSSHRNALRNRASIAWKPSTSACSWVDSRADSY